MFPSKRDSYGLALIEGMAKGCALLGSSLEVQNELIADNNCGVVYDFENDADLTLKLQALLFSPDTKNMAENALITFKNQFSPEIVAKQYLTTWQNMKSVNE